MSLTPLWPLPLLLLVGTLAACSHDAPFTGSNPLDGTWTSAQLPYDIVFHGMIGLAEGVRTKALQDGDPVLRLSAIEGSHMTARLWTPDGQWHSIVMDRREDGSLLCSDGAHQWTLTRTAHQAL